MLRHLEAFRNSSERQTELERLLRSHTDEEIARGLFICAGLLRGSSGPTDEAPALAVPLNVVEQNLFRENPALWVPAAWVFGLYYLRTGPDALLPSPPTLDRLLTLWSGDVSDEIAVFVALALCSQLGRVPRGEWTPALTETQMARVQQASVVRNIRNMGRPISQLGGRLPRWKRLAGGGTCNATGRGQSFIFQARIFERCLR